MINSYNNTIASFAQKRGREILRGMHPDDLKAIWICHECRMVFVFHSDIEDHEHLTAHKMIEKVMMISAKLT